MVDIKLVITAIYIDFINNFEYISDIAILYA